MPWNHVWQSSPSYFSHLPSDFSPDTCLVFLNCVLPVVNLSRQIVSFRTSSMKRQMLEKKKKNLSRDLYNLNWSYLTPWEFVTCTAYQRRQHWTCTRVIVLFINNTQWPVSIYVYRTAKPYSNLAPRDIHLFSLRISFFFSANTVSLSLMFPTDSFLSRFLSLLLFHAPSCLFRWQDVCSVLCWGSEDSCTEAGYPSSACVYHNFPSITHTKTHTPNTRK